MRILEQNLGGSIRKEKLLGATVSGTLSSPETWNQNRNTAQK